MFFIIGMILLASDDDQLVHPLVDLGQLFGRRQPVRRKILGLQSRIELLLQAGNPNLEELVKV